MHMINIVLLTKRKIIAHRRHSTIFRKWDFQVTLPASYKVHTYVIACIHTYMRHVLSDSHYELINHVTSVYIVREQLRRHQPLVHMLARSEYFSIRVVHALFHT